LYVEIAVSTKILTTGSRLFAGTSIFFVVHAG